MNDGLYCTGMDIDFMQQMKDERADDQLVISVCREFLMDKNE